jgi:hypothetical protein
MLRGSDRVDGHLAALSDFRIAACVSVRRNGIPNHAPGQARYFMYGNGLGQ